MRPGLALAIGSLLLGCATDPSLPPFRISIRAEEATWVVGQEDAVREAAARGASYWNGSLDILAGWTLEVRDRIDYPPDAGGVTYLRERRMVVAAQAVGVYSIETLPITHEMGHAILYVSTGDADAGHTDPRWADSAEWRH